MHQTVSCDVLDNESDQRIARAHRFLPPRFAANCAQLLSPPQRLSRDPPQPYPDKLLPDMTHPALLQIMPLCMESTG